MNNSEENRIQYYIQYISSWIYHNVLYTETTAVLLKFIVFVVLLTLIVYQKYHYFAVGIVLVICVSVYLFLPIESVTNPAAFAKSVMTRVDKDELTTGVPLVKEGFGIAMPKIIMGDDSGKDYRRSNKFIEEDSRDFTEKYFNSKKCGIGSGIGGITMFGSNELIGGSRTVALSGVYDFAGNWTDSTKINDSTQTIKQQRYKYFRDCVFVPVKRSVDSKLDNSGGDFRGIKTTIFNNVNNKIININGILERFDTNILFSTYNDPNSDYSQRISLSSKNKENVDISPTNNITYKSLITGNDNKTKLKRIQPLTDTDNINDKLYAELLTMINNDRTMTPSVRERHLEVYAKVYGFRKSLDSIFANMRAQTKDDASLMYTVRIGESVVQELRMMLSYLAMVQRTNDIIQFEKSVGTAKTGIYNMAIPGIPPTGELDVIPYSDRMIDDDATKGTYKSKISGANNIFKIPVEDDTYNNNDEKRYVYGITYYFDTKNSNRDQIV